MVKKTATAGRFAVFTSDKVCVANWNGYGKCPSLSSAEIASINRILSFMTGVRLGSLIEPLSNPRASAIACWFRVASHP